ncbi:MAG: M23 family metallopeptidase [Saprospiraceae bacterium]|nr:M23 family metallopeptidase [Saprospiraceae bacterium]
MQARNWPLIVLGMILCLGFRGEEKYPTDVFRAPVNSPLRLSGTFGELRSNHFHSGIDIKGGIGVPLVSIGDGFVWRIKVEAGGYGNVLYIKHPNGYTSVYAHMHKFKPEIADFVKSTQYQEQQFNLDLYLEPTQFPVTKGEQIGEMGTSGYSFGPHLHFEIRDSKTEKPINPLLFGLDVPDTRKPRMHQIRVYELNNQRETQKAKSYSLYAKGNWMGIKGDTVYVNQPNVGLGLKVYDHMNEVSNWNGVYAVDMFVEDSLVYNYTMETFSFDERRYLNAHLDYEEVVTAKSYFNRTYTLPGNDLNIYKKQENNGVIWVDSDKAQKVVMEARDVEGNTRKLRFWLKQRQTSVEAAAKPYNYILPYDQENIIDNGSLYLHMPKGALYENLYLSYESVEDPGKDIFSNVHHLHDYKTPIHKYYDLSIRPTRLPEDLRDKAFIANCTRENRVVNFGGEWEDGKLKTKVRQLGDFCIMVDTIAPTIDIRRFKSNMRGYSQCSFIIKDNVGTAGLAKGLQFRGTIDGKWVLMEYDLKNDRLTHRFDGTLAAGEHQFRLELWDHLGNTKVFERKFTI